MRWFRNDKNLWNWQSWCHDRHNNLDYQNFWSSHSFESVILSILKKGLRQWATECSACPSVFTVQSLGLPVSCLINNENVGSCLILFCILSHKILVLNGDFRSFLPSRLSGGVNINECLAFVLNHGLRLTQPVPISLFLVLYFRLSRSFLWEDMIKCYLNAFWVLGSSVAATINSKQAAIDTFQSILSYCAHSGWICIALQ